MCRVRVVCFLLFCFFFILFCFCFVYHLFPCFVSLFFFLITIWVFNLTWALKVVFVSKRFKEYIFLSNKNFWGNPDLLLCVAFVGRPLQWHQQCNIISILLSQFKVVNLARWIVKHVCSYTASSTSWFVTDNGSPFMDIMNNRAFNFF